MDEAPQMDLGEFRDKGYLHEANRLFFHPLGLALGVEVHEGNGEGQRLVVIDYRDDPEGVVFRSPDYAKILSVADERARRRQAREESLGWMIQPEDEEVPPHWFENDG